MQLWKRFNLCGAQCIYARVHVGRWRCCSADRCWSKSCELVDDRVRGRGPGEHPSLVATYTDMTVGPCPWLWMGAKWGCHGRLIDYLAEMLRVGSGRRRSIDLSSRSRTISRRLPIQAISGSLVRCFVFSVLFYFVPVSSVGLFRLVTCRGTGMAWCPRRDHAHVMLWAHLMILS